MSGSSSAMNVKLFLSDAHKALLDAGISREQADKLMPSLTQAMAKAQSAGRTCRVRRILVAVDFSPPAARAVESALSLSEELAAEVAVVHVVDVSPVSISSTEHLSSGTLDKLKREGEALCRSVVEKSHLGQVDHFVRCGNPAGEILAVARLWHADLIVIGSHGRTTTGKFFLGSTVETVVRESDCPVMAVGPNGGCFSHHEKENSPAPHTV
ncbi:MAG: universal stress protein [Phycisphaerae bacterium]